ncbi:MAG: hypothetical protein K2X38_03260 [Gemmataceae bacterium]|nr:hypothetical protein [Gemmataceae bacterium]
MHDLFKAQLTSQRQRLIELFQRINYGSIEGLRITAGQPCFDPKPTVLRDIKFGAAENGPRPELAKGNFRLKASLLQLFDLLDEIRDGVLQTIEVKAGLPFRIVVREQANV